MNMNELKMWLINFWPPFLFTGIRVVKRSSDFRHMKVKLKLRFWNANYVGTQYGGSIYSMTDSFYMLMLINILGPEYSVWDKAASIKYLKPGRGDLFAEFNLSEEDLNEIRNQVEEEKRIDWIRKILVQDLNGQIIAEVEKTISIKQK